MVLPEDPFRLVLLYQLTAGRVGGKVQGLQVLLITTIGRRTGTKRTVPLGYFRYKNDYVVCPSNAGFDPQPGWFHNSRVNPHVGIQVGDRKMAATAEPAAQELRRLWWSKLTEIAPGNMEHQKRTTREIPMVVLRTVSET